MKTSPARETGEPPGESWTLRIRDRPAALERVLSMLRRRRVPFNALSVERTPEDDLDVRLRLRIEPERRERILAELAGMADVNPESVIPGEPA